MASLSGNLGFGIGLGGSSPDYTANTINLLEKQDEVKRAEKKAEALRSAKEQEDYNNLLKSTRISGDISPEYLKPLQDKYANFIMNAQKLKETNPNTYRFEVEKQANDLAAAKIAAEEKTKSQRSNQAATQAFIKDERIEPDPILQQFNAAQNDQQRAEIAASHPEKAITFNPETGNFGYVPKFVLNTPKLISSVAGAVKPDSYTSVVRDNEGNVTGYTNAEYKNPEQAGQLLLENSGYKINKTREFNALPQERKQELVRQAAKYNSNDPLLAMATNQFLQTQGLKRSSQAKAAIPKEEKLTENYKSSDGIYENKNFAFSPSEDKGIINIQDKAQGEKNFISIPDPLDRKERISASIIGWDLRGSSPQAIVNVQRPVLDEGGNPVKNIMTGKVETEVKTEHVPYSEVAGNTRALYRTDLKDVLENLGMEDIANKFGLKKHSIATEKGKEITKEDVYIDANGSEHKASDYTPDQIKKALERNQLRLK